MPKILLTILSIACILLTGCGGGSSSSPSTTSGGSTSSGGTSGSTGTPTPNAFAGTYNGSGYSSAGTVGPAAMVIDNEGYLLGSMAIANGSSALSATFSCKVPDTGTTSLLITNANKTQELDTATFSFDAARHLIVTFTTFSGSNVKLRLSSSGQALQYAGSFSGTSTASGVIGALAFAVGSAGDLTGTLTIPSTGAIYALSGNVTRAGAVSWTAARVGYLPESWTGYVGYDGSDQMIANISRSDGAVMSATLN